MGAEGVCAWKCALKLYRFWGSAWAQASACGRRGTGTMGALAQMAGLLVVREAFSPRAGLTCNSAAHSRRGVDRQTSQLVGALRAGGLVAHKVQSALRRVQVSRLARPRREE